MTIEIEAKMRLHDQPALVARLEEHGAEHLADLLETNTFFDTTEGELKSSDQGLRIRVEEDETTGERHTILTHKGPRAHGKLKSRSETEAEVLDPRQASKLLGALGFHAGLSFQKRRSRWVLDGCRVELDDVPHLGSFVEIEGPSEEAVLACRSKLDLAEEPIIKASYIAMLTTHLREHGLTDRYIRFDDPVGAA